MTESRIHELILEISDATTTKTGLNRDDKGLVKEISKTLANLIYSNLEDANKSNRLQLLTLLQKWCSQKQINSNNYQLWLEFLDQYYTSKSDEDLDKSFQELPPIQGSITSEVETYYSRLKQKKVEGHKRLGMIKDLDIVNLKRTSFEYKLPITRSESFDFRLLHNLDNSCQLTKINENAPERATDQDGLREKQVEACYALLNSNLDRDRKLLFKVLEKIASYNELRLFETNLVLNIWKSSDSTDELCLYLFEKFPFVYEKPLLRLCTSILQNLDGRIIPEHEEGELEKIIQVTSGNESVKRSVRSMLCELFLISSCDKFTYLINKFI